MTARAERRFELTSFAATANDSSCAQQSLRETKSALISAGLLETTSSPDVRVEIECSEISKRQPLEGSPGDTRLVTVRQSSFSVSTSYGASLKGTGTLDAGKLKDFLGAHASGCEILAPSPQSFRLSVASEKGGGVARELNLVTPFTLRGLANGQAITVTAGSHRYDACPPDGTLHLVAAPGSGGQAPAVASNGGQVGDDGKPHAAPQRPSLLQFLLAAALAVALLLWRVVAGSGKSKRSNSPAPKIFISYRRSDAGGHAGRLFADLAAKFGKGRVFIDVVGILPGQDFALAIDQALAGADFLLVVIGPDWAQATNGQRVRLEDPNDFVRRETVSALRRGLRVVPVLVGGAVLPTESSLPEDLRPLLRRNAYELRLVHWSQDLDALCAAVGLT